MVHFLGKIFKGKWDNQTLVRASPFLEQICFQLAFYMKTFCQLSVALNPSTETPGLSPCYSSDHFWFCLQHLHWTLSQYQQSLLWTQWKVHCKETYNLISRWKSSCKLFSLLGVDAADVFGLTPSSSWSLVTLMSILSSQSSSWAICSSFRFMPGYVAKENHVI